MHKTILITGASRGIGAACARLFAAEGWRVAVNYRSSHEAARALMADIIARGGEGLLCPGDVGDRAAAQSVYETAVSALGHIDVLINNAGIAQQKLFTDITPAEWDEMFRVNVTGAFNMTQAAAPGMISRKSGSVINISSMWGLTGASCEVHYSASKAALIGMTRALAKELGPSGIRVNAIAPGVIDTDMNAMHSPADMAVLRDETPLMRIGTPEDVARLALYLAGDGASFITGQTIAVDGGFAL